MNSSDETLLLPPTEPMAADGLQDELGPGTRVGGYEVVVRIAQGGCGSVYEAVHGIHGTRVAIKLLRKDFAESREMVERFILEARAVNLIRHPNIVDIFEFGITEDGQPYHVMEMLEGTGLDRRVRDRGRLDEAEVLEILEPLGAALSAAHSHGVVHRDLKPSNIVVSAVADGLRVTVVDFGIAKLLDVPEGQAGLTAVGRKLGTPVSMAPEQILGVGVTHLADVYATGVLLFFCLTGRFPFKFRSPQELEHAHLAIPPPAPSSVAPVSPGIDALVQRCMAKDPRARFQSMDAVVQAFRGEILVRKQSTKATLAKEAVAMYVDVESSFETEDGEDSENDEFAILDDAASVIERVEQDLTAWGWEIAVRTTSVVLGVRFSDSDGESSDGPATLRAAAALAQALAESLTRRAAANKANKVTLAVRLDSALENVDAAGKRFLTGPLLRVHTWCSDVAIPDVRVSGKHDAPPQDET